jgi:MoxR-like ATPase
MAVEDLDSTSAIPDKILTEISLTVVGKVDTKELLLVTLLSGGHLLIEGLPGTAKTTIAKVFAQSIGGQFKRIQFTPDMLPSDVTGFYMYSADGKARFISGPIMANVVLADELNRTTPRTQSALLEAMQENQVSIEGVTYPLPSPFMVIASQLPYGGSGTYPLTTVQIDRFMLRAWSGLPSEDEEREIIGNIDGIEERKVTSVVGLEEILELRNVIKNVHISEKIQDYIMALLKHVRANHNVLQGPSPRAGIALYKTSRALAFLQRRDFVIPDDVKRLAHPALDHRIVMRPEAEMEELTPINIIDSALSQVSVPKEL